MLTSPSVAGLNIVEKMDVVKSRMIKAYHRSLKKGSNKDQAFEDARKLLYKSAGDLALESRTMLAGLEGELWYYSEKRQGQQLKPASATGSHVDFLGMIDGKPAAIDVTTNAFYKEGKVLEAPSEGPGFKYYVGLVNHDDKDLDTYPLLLPRCKDGSLGHFVLAVFESETVSLSGMSDSQVLLRYNPQAETDDEAVDEVLENYNYVMPDPGVTLTEMAADEEEDNGAVHWKSTPSFQTMQEYTRSMSGDARFFKKETGFILSAIVTSDYDWFTKDDGEWVTKTAWIHPDPYIKSVFHDPLSIMNYNIAGVVYGW
jgi:hypothetical protein